MTESRTVKRSTHDIKVISLSRCGFVCLLLLGVVANLFSGPILCGQTAGTKRQVADSNVPSLSALSLGPYFALVIGNNDYRHLKPLQTAVNDATEVAQILQQRYGFEPPKVLLNATRSQILTALYEYRHLLPNNSNLLIYYAGHGHKDPDTKKAYWMPVDADPANDVNWISASTITEEISAIRSLHVLIISDSCYSGALTRSAEFDINSTNPTALIKTMLESPSRTLMSSGRDEPVGDVGTNGHSQFAYVLLESLKRMNEDKFTARQLFDRFVQQGVAGQSEQVPQYDIIQNSGHAFGDFVFSRTTAAGGLEPKAKPADSDAAMAVAPNQGQKQATSIQDLVVTAKEFYKSKNYASALPLFKQAAEAGNPEAMSYLGDYYVTNQSQIASVPKDNAEAVRWYRKAADAGDGRGMSRLGLMYIGGEGVPQNFDMGVGWYHKAIDHGNAEGMMRLAIAYEQGTGVSKNYAEAVTWLRKAADAGDATAMTELGFDYERGQGVGIDYKEAMRWYRKAADLGQESAAYLLGELQKKYPNQ